MACAINLGTTVVLTGGWGSSQRVTEYSEDGFLRDLPHLQEMRASHGCSFYENANGTKVDIRY